MEKTYQPAEVEARHYDRWEKSGAFGCALSNPASGRDKARPFTIVIPPPNVTGSLHMGHALNNTLQDILVRFNRMRGRDALWQPGTDHAGIATQMVVERQLAAEKKTRHDLGRQAFIDRVWKWKAESGGTITRQLRRLGASCDWSRERFTMDEGLSRAVRRVFVALYKNGLIYRDQRLVNWDPKLLTAISDLEVEQREVKGRLWYFNWATPPWRCIPRTSATPRWWGAMPCCRWSAGGCPSSPTNTATPRRAAARSRSPPRTTSTISRSAAATASRWSASSMPKGGLTTRRRRRSAGSTVSSRATGWSRRWRNSGCWTRSRTIR
jgi:hypothetical protein